MAADTKQITSAVQSSYDQIADKYLAWRESQPSPRLRYLGKLLEQCSNSTRNQFKLLELGCGAGIPVTKYLASHPRVAEVFANDISPRQLELAQERVAKSHASVTFIPGDMSSLSFDADSFHGILAFFSLIHLPLAAQRLTLIKIHEWLKPGGCFVCNFAAGRDGQKSPAPVELHAKQQEPPSFGDFFGAPMYWEEADVEGSLTMVRETGLQIVEHEVLDATDGKEVLGSEDPDAGVLFLWVVAVKPATRPMEG